MRDAKGIPIQWTPGDIALLSVYPDYPWLLMPYSKVRPRVWQSNSNTGNDTDLILASTTFLNVPQNFVPVSPAIYTAIRNNQSDRLSDVVIRGIPDDDLIAFIYNDPRFCAAHIESIGTHEYANLVNAWGCATPEDGMGGVYLAPLVVPNGFCALGDQLVIGSFDPGNICKGNKSKMEFARKNHPPRLYSVNRELIFWDSSQNKDIVTRGNLSKSRTGMSAATLRENDILRLNKTIALFRVDYQFDDGVSARPLSLTNILSLSINSNDLLNELCDRSKLGKTVLDIGITQENAVIAYRDSFCAWNQNDPTCSCFRKLPPELVKSGQYDPACHDVACRTEGYKLANMERASTNCPQLNLQVCQQIFNAYGNEGARLDTNMMQKCEQYISNDKTTDKPKVTEDTTQQAYKWTRNRTLVLVFITYVVSVCLLVFLLVF
jgi:hypothetical protein